MLCISVIIVVNYICYYMIYVWCKAIINFVKLTKSLTLYYRHYLQLKSLENIKRALYFIKLYVDKTYYSTINHNTV